MASSSGILSAGLRRLRSAETAAIGRLAGPMALVEVVDYLVLLGTVALMARMEGDALYVRSLYQPIGGVLVAIAVGFAVSNQVSASINRGRERPQDVMAACGGFARVWAGTGLILALALGLGAPALADLFGVTGSVRHSFVVFLRWTALAELCVIGPSLCASALRGFGRIGLATVITLTVAGVRISCVAGLGLGTGMGLWSVPVGAASAGCIGLALGLTMLRRTELWHPRRLRLWQSEVWGLVRGVGLPVAGTLLLIAGYNGAMLWVLRDFDPEIIAGFSVAVMLQGLALLPGMALGSATAVVVNQRRGAGLWERVDTVVRDGLLLSAALYLVLGGTIWLVRDQLSETITGSPGIATATAHYLGTVALTYAIQGPVLTALTLMEQTGGGYFAIVLNAVYFGLVAVAGKLAVEASGNAQALYDTVAISNALGACVVVIALRYAARMRRAAVAP
ncbi:MATE family efflux transporter [Streptomyces sp. SP18BB07]|uniref:MATE family efflux transporter n=1 Tax=Streptomyces sp. SP18BB07 TaxID=3002522 RepID=UPI002E790646|nr:MATE family efflux transporter [Streptomyces sp. SP18BB07]MEE1757684.1 MATE family efflux transporter [Streptomyces sp. SP18BB07]